MWKKTGSKLPKPIPSNGGGNNKFYWIPLWVRDVDDLVEYLKAPFSVGNIIKSAFSLLGPRHGGTEPIRDAEKMVHYSIRYYMSILREQADEPGDISKALVIHKLQNELSDEDKELLKLLLEEHPID